MANILLDTRTVDRYKQRIAELEAQLKESQALVQLGRDRIEVLEAELALWDGREAYLVGKIDELEAELTECREERDKLRGALEIIVSNATMIDDPTMEGITDCFRVPLEDIEIHAHGALSV